MQQQPAHTGLTMTLSLQMRKLRHRKPTTAQMVRNEAGSPTEAAWLQNQMTPIFHAATFSTGLLDRVSPAATPSKKGPFPFLLPTYSILYLCHDPLSESSTDVPFFQGPQSI